MSAVVHARVVEQLTRLRLRTDSTISSQPDGRPERVKRQEKLTPFRH